MRYLVDTHIFIWYAKDRGREGLVNRITPFHTDNSNNFDTEKTYDMMMNKFKYGGLDKPVPHSLSQI